MRIGIDFDNTIACYKGVFYKAALERELIPKDLEQSKGSVRDYLRSHGKEEDWTELQGYIYGSCMDLALPYSGVESFIKSALQNDRKVFIISHKTKHPYLGPSYDLHQTAKSWLQHHSFDRIPAFFEITLEEKLKRIKALECDYFIDDLPELLSEKGFPEKVRKILFDPYNTHPSSSEWMKLSSWGEISELFNIGSRGTTS